MKLLFYTLSIFVILLSCNKNNAGETYVKLANGLLSLSFVDTLSQTNPNYAAPNVVNVGPSLHRKIKDFYHKNDKTVVKVIDGDTPYPIGDATATQVLTIENRSTNKSLNIRLKYDTDQKMYHIVGYY